MRHVSTATVIDFQLVTDVDANLASVQDPTIVYSTSDGAGRIDLHTNGQIVSTESIGDLLVGTITSTGGNVTLTASDFGASILDGSGITDGSARVTGNVITLTANGTVGGIQPAGIPLAIWSSYSGAGWLAASAPDGVYVTQVEGDLVLSSGFATAGDVSLVALNGSILNLVNNGTIRIVGTNIDLQATGGSIGSLATGDILIDTAVNGRLLALSTGTPGASGVFITEADGPLTVLLAHSTDGQVRLTVPFVAGRDDADITLLPTGTSLDGLILIGQGGVVGMMDVELRMGNDLMAPLGTLISGADVTIRTAFGQNPAAPVGTTAYFGGELTAPRIQVFGGNGADLVEFFETVIDGNTAVFGGSTATAVGADGDDRVEITRITILPGTHLGTGGDSFDGLPVRNALSVDGQNGNNHTEVTVWGAEDQLAHDTLIEVIGSGTDPFAINTLTINASNGDDLVLLRAVNFVPNRPDARLPSMVSVASSATTVERISYDRSVNGKLTVNGLDGDDTFALDDTSSPLTINGGAGDDVFLVGQFFTSVRTAPFVEDHDAFFTHTTDRGQLSNGISRPAVLYGDDGDDQFVISSNRSELRLEGGAGTNSFLVITSNDLPVIGAPAPHQNGFVSIDAGEQGELTIVADGATITFDNLWWTVLGAGLNLDLYGFSTEPQYVNSVTLRTPVGLDGEDGAALMRLVLPPYPFVDRGAGASVIITETEGWTIVHPDGPLTDSYTIRLATASTHTVYITITSAFGGGSPFALFSIDGGLTWVARAVLAIAAGDLSEHLVMVRWAGLVQTIDDLPVNARIGTISHTVSSDDPAFDGADIRNVYVNLIKGAQIDPAGPGGPTVPILPVTGADASPLVAGGLLLFFGGILLLVAGRRRHA